MPAYAYPINIKRDPQKIKYHKIFNLESGLLTISELQKYVSENEEFSITRDNEDYFSDEAHLHVYGFRLETEEELNARIQKQEAYMLEYNRRQELKINKNHDKRNFQ